MDRLEARPTTWHRAPILIDYGHKSFENHFYANQLKKLRDRPAADLTFIVPVILFSVGNLRLHAAKECHCWRSEGISVFVRLEKSEIAFPRFAGLRFSQ
jgi:hypothetical protein